MLKLKQYLKPYIALLLGAVILLFGQAMLELTLPNYMSDIVNVGLQQGGITYASPEAIDTQSMQLMQRFMSEQERQLVADHYLQLDEGEQLAQLQKTYPNLKEGDFALTGEHSEEIEGVFSRASYALVQFLEGMMQQNAAQDSSSTVRSTLDIAMLAQASAAFDPQQVQQAVETAAVTPESMISQTGPVLVKSLYRALGADTDAIQTGYIIGDGIKMLGLTVLLTGCAIGAGFCLSRLGAGVGRDLRRDVFTRVTYFNNSEMDQFSTASLITRSTNDITQIQNFLSMGLRMLCFAPIMGFGGLIMGLSKCVSLAWVLALALVIMLGLILILFSVALPRFKKMQKLVDRLNLVSREELSGMMVVRAFANQNFMQKRFDAANRDLVGNTLFVNRAMATMMPAMTLVMNGISLLIVWFGGKQIAQSNLQVGDMMAFIQYAMQIIMSFLMITILSIMLPRASVSGKRISEILETQATIHDPEKPRTPNVSVKGRLEFDHVSFAYPDAEEEVLSDISFTAEKGETIAIIGSTGSGKSTLVNLIPRFYDVTKGEIRLDGVDIRKMSQKDVRGRLGYVPQKGVLFSGTIDSNIRYGRPEAPTADVERAAQIAQAEEFIKEKPEGYASPIAQGGTNVSGGQKQRLSIARAIEKNPEILIFDDSFSALDYKTDVAVRRALREATAETTTIIVAQRISTILHADKIIVLDEGRMAGMGTHRELLENCEVYRQIAESQLSKEELAG